MSQAERLTALLDDIRSECERFFSSIPEPERIADGSWEAWSLKDVIAHLHFWHSNLLASLNGLDQPPPEQEPFMERNRKNYLFFQKRPWSEVYAAYAKSLDEILTHIAKFTDTELTTPNRFPRINGTLQASVLGNTYAHTITHLSELMGRRAGVAVGQEFQERATRKLIEFDSSPGPKAVALYNLACFHALAGNTPRVVELLREAFLLRPDLVQFSREDTDFQPIRGQPEFQALYAEAASAAAS